jgi:flagellar hook protein FlgE
MSLFGALNTAISGLDAQSTSFGNISDNVANSQTVGFKRTDTSFSDYLTTSSATVHDSGAVVTTPDYRNGVQGTIAQSSDPLALAITGQGFFAVSHPTSTGNSASSSSTTATFSTTQYYTRAGDFTMNNNGYIVNSAGDYLDGWAVNSQTGVVSRNTLSPIQISQTSYNPVATSELTLSANLPATPSSADPVSSQIDVYDAVGTAHPVSLNWTQQAAPNTNVWTVQIVSPTDLNATPTNAVTDASGNPVLGTADVTFGTDGTIASIGNPVSDYGTVGSQTTGGAGTPASFSFSGQFEAGVNQTITLNLGTYGSSAGMTQYAGTTYAQHSITQDGVPPGSFSSVTATAAGDIMVNYDNGQSRTIARVPITTFNDPSALQSQNGQAFTATTASGTPSSNDASTNGAGALVTGSVESSNVDIASQFTSLIVAQNAYSANAKVITTANSMLQTTIDMLR